MFAFTSTKGKLPLGSLFLLQIRRAEHSPTIKHPHCITLSAQEANSLCLSAHQRKFRTCAVVTSSQQLVLSSRAPWAQTTLNSAIGQNMSQRSQQPLVYILLFWTSILSIILFVFIALLFTRGQSSNSSNVEYMSQSASTSYANEIFNFQAQDSGIPQTTIEWVVQRKSDLILKEPNKPLRLMNEGNYILNLRVTLSLCRREEKSSKSHSVTLMLMGKARLIGWTDETSNSTGLLSKVMFLPKGANVEINIHPPSCINENLTVTYMDIMLLDRQRSQ